MTFDPVLWLLVYLLIGSLIWMVLFGAGEFEDWPTGWAVVASTALIAGWGPLLLILIVMASGGCIRLRRVDRAEAAR